MSSVILFDSRARGAFRPKSDIDLAVVGGDFRSFTLNVDETTSMLFSFDFVNMNELHNENLCNRIAKEGLVLYEEVVTS